MAILQIYFLFGIFTPYSVGEDQIDFWGNLHTRNFGEDGGPILMNMFCFSDGWQFPTNLEAFDLTMVVWQ